MEETNEVVSFEGIDLYRGDCLEVMDRLIETGVKVDAIITDPPYGTTACKWDSVIPFDEMWLRLNQLIKPNGAIVLFGSEPFSSLLRVSNLKMYKYDIIWEKEKPTNIFLLNKRIGSVHENISIFNTNNFSTYNPQMEKRINVTNPKPMKGNLNKDPTKIDTGVYKHSKTYNPNLIYPRSVLKFNRDSKKGKTALHPTQKPVALMEYLIKTYTNEGELVLDFTIGSGTTAVACVNTKRKCIGIERDDKYFDISCKRVDEAVNKPNVELF